MANISLKRYLVGLALALSALSIVILRSGMAGDVVELPGSSTESTKVGVCAQQDVVTQKVRVSAGLPTWPDGTLGVVRERSGYIFVGSDGTRGVATTHGTLEDPLRFGVLDDPRIAGLATSFDYAAGGPVYRDATTGRWLLFYHSERWPGGRPDQFYSSIGIATSTDQGRSWQDLGQIIRPHAAYDAAGTRPIEVGGGPFVVVGGFFYVYFRDDMAPGRVSEFSVARARIVDVVSASASGRLIPWDDYYKGGWDQPALGGLASPLEGGNPHTRWFDVSFDAQLREYILVTAADDARGVNLYMALSPDGLHWSPRRAITTDQANLFYPTLVGLGPDPGVLNRKFFIYYTTSQVGQPRWDSAFLARRPILLGRSC